MSGPHPHCPDRCDCRGDYSFCPKLKRLPGFKLKRLPGFYEHTVTICGTEILCTYNLEGGHFAADENGPEEFPTVELVSVDFGGGPVFGAYAAGWDDLLNLTALIEEQAET